MLTNTNILNYAPSGLADLFLISLSVNMDSSYSAKAITASLLNQQNIYMGVSDVIMIELWSEYSI